METVGFVGVGKIGMPISANLIRSGYRRVSAIVAVRLPSSKSSAACRHVRPLKSARKRTSFFPACHPTRLSRKSCKAREGWYIRRGLVRSSSSSVRIRFPQSEAD